MSAVVWAAFAGPVIGWSIAASFYVGYGWRDIALKERVLAVVACAGLAFIGGGMLAQAIGLEAAAS